MSPDIFAVSQKTLRKTMHRGFATQRPKKFLEARIKVSEERREEAEGEGNRKCVNRKGGNSLRAEQHLANLEA